MGDGGGGLCRAPGARSGASKRGLIVPVVPIVLREHESVPTSWRGTKQTSDISHDPAIAGPPDPSGAERVLTHHAASGLEVLAAALVILAHGVTLAAPLRVKAIFTATHAGL